MKINGPVALIVCVTILATFAMVTIIVITGYEVSIVTGAIATIFATATGFITVFTVQKKQGGEIQKQGDEIHKQTENIETIRSNTNGTLTRILDSYERAIAREAIMASEVRPEIMQSLHEHTLKPEEIRKLREAISRNHD